MEEMGGGDAREKYLSLEMFVASFITYQSSLSALKCKYNFYSSHKLGGRSEMENSSAWNIYYFYFLLKDIES